MLEKEYLTEFRMLEQQAKEQVWACVNNLYWLCGNCLSVQDQPFSSNGVREIYYSGWETGFGPDVLGNIKHMTSIALPKKLGERLDAYGQFHIKYDCKIAAHNIAELREELAELMRVNGNSGSKQEFR